MAGDPNAPALLAPASATSEQFGGEYLSSIEGQYQSRWGGFLEDCRQRLPASHPLNDESLRVTLSIDVSIDSQRRATVSAVKVSESSGNREFDAAALEVAGEVQRLPDVPAALRSDDGALYLEWSFARDRRQAGSATARVHVLHWPVERAVPKLLKEGDVALAAERLEEAAGSGAVDGLLSLADDVAAAAIASLLESEDVTRQRIGIRAATQARLASAAETLRELAARASDLDLRREALAALGSIGDHGAVPLLVEVLRGGTGADRAQRAAAARSLHQLGAGAQAWAALAPGLEATGAGGATGEESVAETLSLLAEFPAGDATDELTALLEGAGSRAIRQAAAKALGAAVVEAGARAGKPLIAGLSARDGAVRAACAGALADAARAGFTSKSAYWAVVGLLKDRDERVRAAATLASAAFGREAFVKEMYRLRKETSIAVLQALAEGLAWVPGEDSLNRLLAMRDAQDVGLRRAVARSLAAREESSAKQALAEWVDDEDPEVRAHAIQSLDDLDQLTRLVEHEVGGVRAVAFETLLARKGRAPLLARLTHVLAASGGDPESADFAARWLAAR